MTRFTRPKLLQPVQALKAHSLTLASKNFHTARGCQKIRFAPTTPDPLCAKDTRHLIVLPEMVTFNDPLTVGLDIPQVWDLHL